MGELDEEMVYEARAGQVIVLGASSWRIEEITRDRVLVSPAPGVPGAVPFWKGEGVGRPYELGEAIGKFARELLAAKADPKVPDLDERAERESRRLPPRAGEGDRRAPDRTVVVERFRDEIGDWRVCILTPFGARVHAPWAMAVAARLREFFDGSLAKLSKRVLGKRVRRIDSGPVVATALLEGGSDIRDTQRIMRHALIDTTQLYLRDQHDVPANELLQVPSTGEGGQQ